MILVLIPAFNAEYTIGKTVLKVKKHGCHVIVYDDGSTDLTAEIAEKMGAHVKRGKENRGKGFALKVLFEEAKKRKPDVAITLDSDDQHDADEIPQLLKPLLRAECDVTVGQRQGRSWFRKLGGQFLNLFSSRDVDVQSGFRAYSWKALQQIEVKTKGYGVDQQIIDDLIEKGLKIKQIPVLTKYNKYSHVKNPISHFYEVFNYIFFRKPLLHLGIIGLFAFFGGIYGLVQIVQIYAVTKELALGTFLFSMLFIILGALAFFVGVILHVVVRSKKANKIV